MRIVPLITIFSLWFVPSTNAADTTLLIGKWIEHLRNGAAMIVEFTPKTISFYPVDPSGKPTSEPRPMEVAYRDLGETVAVDFKGGGGVMVAIKDRQSAVLIFPGMGSHSLIRLQR